MDEKTKDSLSEGLERLEDAEISEITDADLDAVAGGQAAPVDDGGGDLCSGWCCSTSG